MNKLQEKLKSLEERKQKLISQAQQMQVQSQKLIQEAQGLLLEVAKLEGGINVLKEMIDGEKKEGKN